MRQRLRAGDAVVDAAVRRIALAIDAEPGAINPESGVTDAEPGAMDPEPGAMDPEPGVTDAQPGAVDAGPGSMTPEARVLDPEREVRSDSNLSGRGKAVPLDSTQRTSGDPQRLRCASLLKPLLFWVVAREPGFQANPRRWRELAEPAVMRSANEPTVEIWREVGAGTLLESLRKYTGVRWTVEPGGRSFGRVLVRADEVVAAYAALVVAAAGSPVAGQAGASVARQAGDPVARQVLLWMQRVGDDQSFGVRSVAAQVTATPVSSVAIKCGWFSDADELHIRTHAVTISGWSGSATVTPPRDPGRPFARTDATAEGTERTLAITCVLTALPISDPDRTAYAAADERGEELPIHERHAGAILRDRTRTLLSQKGPAE
ncbi:MAG: hypothetical protein ABJA87_11265 [bacterium]